MSPGDVALDSHMCICVWRPDRDDGSSVLLPPHVEMWGLGEADREVLGVPAQGGYVEQRQ